MAPSAPSQPFTVDLKSDEGIPILEIHGYYGPEAGIRTHEVVQSLLQKNQNRIIFDFTACKLISSPGVVALMKMTMEIVEDFQGDLAIAGLDNLKFTVLDMAGVFPMAIRAMSRQDAIRLLKNSTNVVTPSPSPA